MSLILCRCCAGACDAVCDGISSCCAGCCRCFGRCCEGLASCCDSCCRGIAKCCDGICSAIGECCSGVAVCLLMIKAILDPSGKRSCCGIMTALLFLFGSVACAVLGLVYAIPSLDVMDLKSHPMGTWLIVQSIAFILTVMFYAYHYRRMSDIDLDQPMNYMWYDPGVAAFLILSVFTLVWSALGLSWLFDTDYSKNDYLYGLCEGMAIAGIVNSGLWLGFCMLGLCGAVVGCMVASICSCFMSVICPCLGLHQAQHASDNLIDENAMNAQIKQSGEACTDVFCCMCFCHYGTCCGCYDNSPLLNQQQQQRNGGPHPPPPAAAAAAPAAVVAPMNWMCPSCTFSNQPSSGQCGVCGAPRPGQFGQTPMQHYVAVPPSAPLPPPAAVAAPVYVQASYAPPPSVPYGAYPAPVGVVVQMPPPQQQPQPVYAGRPAASSSTSRAPEAGILSSVASTATTVASGALNMASSALTAFLDHRNNRAPSASGSAAAAAAASASTYNAPLPSQPGLPEQNNR